MLSFRQLCELVDRFLDRHERRELAEPHDDSAAEDREEDHEPKQSQ